MNQITPILVGKVLWWVSLRIMSDSRVFKFKMAVTESSNFFNFQLLFYYKSK